MGAGATLRIVPRRLLVLIAVLLAAVSLLAACGDDDEEKEGLVASEPCAAAPAALTGPTNLGPNFPIPDDVVITATRSSGPSTVVSGYSTKSIKELYEAFKEELAEDPYSVTKDEIEKHDAEVNFSGENTTGQVRLGEECKDRRSVDIVARPS